MFNFLYSSCSDFVKSNGDIIRIVRLIYNAIKIGVPIILIVVGMFDMGKAITQQKEDEIKKAQSLLVKKAVAAVLVFLMFAIVQLLVGLVSSDGEESVINCVDTILNDSSETNDSSKTTDDNSQATEQ